MAVQSQQTGKFQPKYYKKVDLGNGLWRYFYSQQEYEAYLRAETAVANRYGQQQQLQEVREQRARNEAKRSGADQIAEQMSKNGGQTPVDPNLSVSMKRSEYITGAEARANVRKAKRSYRQANRELRKAERELARLERKIKRARNGSFKRAELEAAYAEQEKIIARKKRLVRSTERNVMNVVATYHNTTLAGMAAADVQSGWKKVQSMIGQATTAVSNAINPMIEVPRFRKKGQ